MPHELTAEARFKFRGYQSSAKPGQLPRFFGFFAVVHYRIRFRVNSTATPQQPSGLGSVRTTVPRAASRKAGATPASAESRTATVTATPNGISLMTHIWSPALLKLSSTECSLNTRPVLSTPFSLPGKGASIRAVSLRSFTGGS